MKYTIRVRASEAIIIFMASHTIHVVNALGIELAVVAGATPLLAAVAFWPGYIVDAYLRQKLIVKHTHSVLASLGIVPKSQFRNGHPLFPSLINHHDQGSFLRPLSPVNFRSNQGSGFG